MILKKEREVKCYEFDADFTKEEAKELKEYGLKIIADDDNALINYAVNKILTKYVENQKEIQHIKKFSKRKILKRKGTKCK